MNNLQAKGQQFFLFFVLLSFFCVFEAQAQPSSVLQLERAINNWNKYYGANVKAVGWKYLEKITSAYQFKEITKRMTSPEIARFPIGDVGKPSQMMAGRIIDDPRISPRDLDKWRDMVVNIAKTGEHIFHINWTIGASPFTTICITDDRSLVYDSMLFNVVLVEKHSKCIDYLLGWLWGSWTRGKISGDLKANCNGGKPATCDKNCVAHMVLGEAKINCKSNIKENCCDMEYSWAWACGFKNIELGKDGFSLKIEGILGTSGAGNGSCTDYCK